MPGPVLHVGAVVLCGHGGQASPTAPMPRVLVSGQPVATIAAPYVVAGCPFASAPGPCVSGVWVIGALRVTSMAQPLAIQGGMAVCVPNGAPLIPSVVQPRVIAT